jgi:hypothetical protein
MKRKPAGSRPAGFLAVYYATDLGCCPCFKRESGRGDRYCEVVQCE